MWTVQFGGLCLARCCTTVPKKNRLAVYSYLFKEGTIVVRKELIMDKHPNIEVPRLHVVKLLQSLHSRALVKEQFNWQYLYYTLTDAGIEYLREYLHVSADTVPATLKKSSRPQPPPSFGRSREEDGGRGRGRGRGRGGYRGPREFSGEGASGEFAGRGRGRGGFGGRGRGRGAAAAAAPES